MNFSNINIQTAIIAGVFTLIGGLIAGLAGLAQSIHQGRSQKAHQEREHKYTEERYLLGKREIIYFEMLNSLQSLVFDLQDWECESAPSVKVINTLDKTITDYGNNASRYIIYGSIDISSEFSKSMKEINKLRLDIVEINALRAKKMHECATDTDLTELNLRSELVREKINLIRADTCALLAKIREHLGIFD